MNKSKAKFKNEIKKYEIEAAKEWLRYDDEGIHFVSKNWSAVLTECLEDNFAPNLLFYEKK